MNKKKSLLVLAVVVIVFAIITLVMIAWNQKQSMVTITGEYRGTKGGGVVDGVYIPGSELKESVKYNGKVIEIKGSLKEYPCPKNMNFQCFNGPMMTKIQSIREVNN